MRLRCRKCRKINDFIGDAHAAWVSNCAFCGAKMMKQFLSFAEMRRMDFSLKEKEDEKNS